MTDSAELLRHYVKRGSEEAFEEVVRLHVDLVYSTALRKVRGDVHLAQDITQMVFADLARKARTFSHDMVLGGWLYRHTCFKAGQAVREESSRRIREQKAADMNTNLENSDDEWKEIAPLLDNAMEQLSAPDRDLIVLRFFEKRDLRAVGAAFGISDDTAQKRVSRALEKLRCILVRRGVTPSATALATTLGSQAVVAAPAGLAGVVSGSALAGVAAGSGVGLTFFELMTISKIKAGAISALLVAGVAVPLVMQHQTNTALSVENAELRQQVEAISSAEPRQAIGSPQGGMSFEEIAQAAEDRRELLRLRNLMREAREQIALLQSGPAETPSPMQAAVPSAPDGDEMRQLGLAASRGDFTALDRLAEHSAAAFLRRTNDNQYVHREISLAFDVLGSEASNGNEVAFEALWRATRMKHLTGLAVQGLGIAAGQGHEQAIEVLLDPERFLLVRSSTVSALRPAAENGNLRAIQALAEVVADEKAAPLWYLAASGLRQAAVSGDPTAIDAMALLALSEDEKRRAARKVALLALENASFRGHPRAQEVLRMLGYQ